jgi:hypothetical protein
MAQVRDKARNIDETLGSAEEAWKSLPEVAEEIPGWEPVERIDFVYDWAVEEMKLKRLRRQEKAGAMNPAQLERFRELENLVERNRPIIEKMRKRYNS